MHSQIHGIRRNSAES